ncbi:hypothetical protein GILI108418_07100 [Gillisia limnaea]
MISASFFPAGNPCIQNRNYSQTIPVIKLENYFKTYGFKKKINLSVRILCETIKTHYDLSVAKSDSANMLDLKYLEKLLSNLVAIRKTVNNL